MQAVHTSGDHATPAPRGRALAARVRDLRQRRPWVIEIALFALALCVYQVSRALVVGDPTLAFQNAWDLIRWEQRSGLSFETGLQQMILDHVSVMKALNYFYMYAHWVVTTAFFVWLYRSRRSVYPFVRNAFFLANAVSLAVFVVFPVAPPRLIKDTNLVDTLRHVSDIDLHGGPLAALFNPYAAVPSMHFGYAFMIGLALAALMRSWPLRLLALAYPAIVFVAIIATANHYVIDTVAGAAAVIAAFAVFGVRALVRRSSGPVLAAAQAQR